jgi:hypothetical protein
MGGQGLDTESGFGDSGQVFWKKWRVGASLLPGPGGERKAYTRPCKDPKGKRICELAGGGCQPGWTVRN